MVTKTKEDYNQILVRAFVNQYKDEATAKAALRELFLAAGYTGSTAKRYANGLYRDATALTGQQ